MRSGRALRMSLVAPSCHRRARLAVLGASLALTACAASTANRPGVAAAEAPACSELDGADRSPRPEYLQKVSSDSIEQARDLTRAAVELVDRGEFAAAREKLDAAQKLAPSDGLVRYESAYAYYLEKRGPEAIALLVRGTELLGPVGYQLLGNTFDALGKPGCALRTYAEGLERFPDAGPLYLERGVVQANQGDNLAALGSWERGIEADPTFPSNYFHAARIFAMSNVPIWALFYGEAFLNLAPDDKRTAFVADLIRQVYRDHVTIDRSKPGEAAFSVSFVDGYVGIVNGASGSLPFASRWELTTALGVAMAEVIPEGDWVSIENLSRIRAATLAAWRKDNPTRPLEHPLLEWQAELADAGLLEAYDHVLFARALPDEARAYAQSHPREMEKLGAFLGVNRLPIEGASSFVRTRFEGHPSAPPREDVLAAIARLEADPIAASVKDDCATIVRFTVASDAVMVVVSNDTLPWTTGGEPADSEAHGTLLCAYMGGNVRAQLERGQAKDMPKAGLDLARRVYAKLRAAGRMPRIDGLEAP